MSDKVAIFEVMYRNGRRMRHIRIWPDGRVEGFDGPYSIINRIPLELNKAKISGIAEEKR